MSWITVVLVVVAVSSVQCRPSTIYNYETDRLGNRQSGIAGRAVTGGYSWTAPNGQKFSVNYIADSKGYRIVDSQSRAQSYQSPAAASPSVLPPAPSQRSFPAPRVAPTLPKPQTFARFKQPNPASNFFNSQDDRTTALANSHFGINTNAVRRPTYKAPTTTTTTTTRRPWTVIFFNTTPKPTTAAPATTAAAPAKKSLFYHPNQFKNINTRTPAAAPKTAPVASDYPKSVSVKETAEAKTAEVAETSSAGSSTATAAEKTEEASAPAEAGAAETEAGAAEAEGGEAAEGAEAEGGEAAAAEGEAEGEEGAEAEAEGREGAEAEGGEGAEDEGAEAEGAEAEAEEEEGAEGEGQEAEEEGEEGSEGEEEAEDNEYEEEEESGSNSEAEEW